MTLDLASGKLVFGAPALLAVSREVDPTLPQPDATPFVLAPKTTRPNRSRMVRTIPQNKEDWNEVDYGGS